LESGISAKLHFGRLARSPVESQRVVDASTVLVLERPTPTIPPIAAEQRAERWLLGGVQVHTQIETGDINYDVSHQSYNFFRVVPPDCSSEL
jgi:hypothetical protein